MQRVGSCSLCGGDVVGHRGGWWSITPPPLDQCSGCGARRADDVIEMCRVAPPQDTTTVLRNVLKTFGEGLDDNRAEVTKR